MNWLVGLVVSPLLNYVVSRLKESNTWVGLVGVIAAQVPALAPFKELILSATLAAVAFFTHQTPKAPDVANSASALKVAPEPSIDFASAKNDG